MRYGCLIVSNRIAVRPAVLRCWLILCPLCAALIVGGLLLGQQFMDLAMMAVHLGNEAQLQVIAMPAIAIYMIVAALPFVPAAEIGLGLMVMFGPPIAGLVYTSTVLALLAAYLIGRAVPAPVCAAGFGFLGMRKAQDLVLETAALNASARLELLLARAPRRVVPVLIRHRYLALALALNLPGNTVLGGGGGIALAAGMSGLYPLPPYLATVAIAVAPVPLLVALSTL